MAGQLTGKTFSLKIDVDLGDAESKLQNLKSQVESLQTTLSKNINSQVNINFDQKALEQKLNDATKKMNTTAAAVAQQAPTTQAAPTTSKKSTPTSSGPKSKSGGGSSGGPPGGGGSGGYFGSEARGDRSGGFLSRAKSVAEFTVAAKAVSGVFSGIEKGLSSIVQVQNQLQQLNKVINTSQANLEDFKKTAIETGKEFGASTTDVLKSFQIFAQQGFSTDEVKKYGKAVIAAKNVSEFDVEELSGLFSTARKTYAKELGDNPQRLTDSLLAVEGQFAVSESELGEVVKRIGPQAKALGMSFDQLNAVTTVMKERTRAPAEEIATSLRFITKNLVDPNVQKDVQAIANSVGEKIEFTTPTGDIRNSYDILQDLSQLYPKLNNMSKVQLANTVAETRFLPKFAGLMEGYGDAARVVTISQNAQGETTKRNQIAMQSIGKQADKTGQAFEAFALSMGSGLTQPILSALRAAEKLLNTLESVGNFKPVGFVTDLLGGDSTGPEGSPKQSSLGDYASMLALPLSLMALSKGLGGLKSAGGFFGKTKGGPGAVPLSYTGQAGQQVPYSAFDPKAAMRDKRVSQAQSLVGGASDLLLGTAFIGTGKKIAQTIGSGIVKAAATGFGGAMFSKVLGGIGTAVGSFAGPLGTVGGLAAGMALSAAIQEGFSRLTETGTERSQRLGISDKRANASVGIGVGNQILQSAEALKTLDKELELFKPENKEKLEAEQKIGTSTRKPEEVRAERDKTFKDLRNFVLSNEKLLKETKGVDISKDGKINFNGQDIFKNPEALRAAAQQIKAQQEGKEAVFSLGESLNVFKDNLDSLSTDKESGLGLLRKSGSIAQGRSFDLSRTDKSIFTKAFGLKEQDSVKRELQTGEITAPIVKPLLNQLNTALRSGKPEDLESVLKTTSTGDLQEMVKTMDLMQGDRASSDIFKLMSSRNTDHNKQARELAVGVALRRDFEDMGRAAKDAKENMIGGFKKGESSVDKIAKSLEDAAEGDIVSFTGSTGELNRGRVYKDSLGVKQVQALSQAVFDSNATSTGAIDTAKSSIIPLESILNNAKGGVNIVRPNAVAGQDQTQTVFQALQRSGFGAGQSIETPALSLGPSRLSDMSDVIAGTLQNFSGGEPSFNKDLQQFILQLSKLQKENVERFSPGKVTEANVETKQQLDTYKIQEESATLIAKAVESFGRSIKALDSSIQKFQGFQNKQLANQASPVTSTGPLQALGGEAIPIAIGKTKEELSPMESAQLAIPNTAKQLSKLQFQFAQISSLMEGSANEVDSVMQSINSTSGTALKSIDQEKLTSLLEGFKSGGQITEQESNDSMRLISALSNSTSDLKNTGKSREQIISELTTILTKGQTNFLSSLKQARDDANPEAAQLETAMSTAISLEALKKGADDASRSLQQLEKLGSMFDNLDMALGEGPFGRLGAAGQPTFFQQNQEGGAMNPLDFSNMNSFEQRRDLIRKLSSQDVRSGKTKILDQNLNPVAAINDEQKKAQLQAIDIEESRVKRAQVEQRQREQLAARRDKATEAVGNIDDILNTANLSKESRKGLTDIRNSIESVGNLPEKRFLTGRGDINLSPFDVLKSVGPRVQALLPKDKTTAEVENYLKQLQANLGGITGNGAGTTGAKQSESQQVVSAVTSGTDRIVSAIYDVNGKSPTSSQTPTPTATPTAASQTVKPTTGTANQTTATVPTAPTTTGLVTDTAQRESYARFTVSDKYPKQIATTTSPISVNPYAKLVDDTSLDKNGYRSTLTPASLNTYSPVSEQDITNRRKKAVDLRSNIDSFDAQISTAESGGNTNLAASLKAQKEKMLFDSLGTSKYQDPDYKKTKSTLSTLSGLSAEQMSAIPGYGRPIGKTGEAIPGIEKVPSTEGKLIYKSTQSGLDNSSKESKSENLKGSANELGSVIETSLNNGGGAVSQYITTAMEAGAQAWKSVADSVTSVIQSAIAELAKANAARPAPTPTPAPAPAPTPGTRGVGGKEADVTGMLEQFVTEQARREEDRKIKMSEMEQQVSNIGSTVSELQTKFEQSGTLESLQSFVNQAVQDTKNLAEKAFNTAETITSQITTINSQIKTVESKIDSTQMLAEQARARGR